jgi:phage repressor protein C with HTH and peptisase S24 domain
MISEIINSKNIKKVDFKKELELKFGEDIPKATFYSYLDGTRNIPQNLWSPIAKSLDVSVGEIFNDSDTLDFVKEFLKNPNKETMHIIKQSLPQISSDVFNIPIKDLYLGAGNGGIVDVEQIETIGYQDIDKKLLPPDIVEKNLMIGKVFGRSMEPTFYEDDMVVIEKKTRYELPMKEDYYFINYDGLLQIKYLGFPNSESIYIISDNSQFPTIVYKQTDTQIQFEILGRVLVNVRNFTTFKRR